jgi:hypothetical protein
MGYGIKLKKLDMYVNVSPSANFNRSVNSINGQINNSNNLNSNFSVYLSKSEKKYDINLNNTFSNSRNSTSQNNEVKSFNTIIGIRYWGLFFRENGKFRQIVCSSKNS